jgi:hypothetical protein
MTKRVHFRRSAWLRRILLVLVIIAGFTLSASTFSVSQASATLYIKRYTWTHSQVFGHGTFTITGSGFGSEPVAAVTNPCGKTGNDFPGLALAVEDSTNGWTAGSDTNGSPSCLGIKVKRYTNTSIAFSVGNDFKFVTADIHDVITFYIQETPVCTTYWERNAVCPHPRG